MFLSRRSVTVLAATGLLASSLGWASGQPAGQPPSEADVIRDAFESDRPSWQREYTDATVRLLAHERSDRAAHGGRLSEHFQFEAGPGSRFFVSEAVPNIPVSEDLSLSLYVRSNQSGAQLFAWVVLPGDIDPDTKAPSYLLVPGTVFNRPDRWEKLELVDMLPAIEEQARVLRASSRRPVSIRGAYLARVVVNLMGGRGETDVFLDDLQIGPVAAEIAAAWASDRSRPRSDAASAKVQAEKALARKAKARGDSTLPAIQFTRGVLEKLVGERRYAPWFPTAIEAEGANPLVLRQAGFDVLVTGEKPDPKKIGPAVKAGMFLLPRLSGANEEGGAQRVLEAIDGFPLRGDVVLWSIGDRLGRQREAGARMQEVEKIREVLSVIHDGDDELRLATATVESEFRLYSRAPSNLDVIGMDLPIWGSSMSMSEGLSCLIQRRLLTSRSNGEALFWAWLPATIPNGVMRNIWGSDEVPSWGRPPVQPEQLRLMAYMALAGGCRGLSFVGDSDLTRPAGESLLIEMNFLNAEIDLFEEILARNIQVIADYPVHDPDPLERPTTANVNQKRMPVVKELGAKPGLHAAAVPLIGNNGALILLADLAIEAQRQPHQMAYHDLVITARLPQGVQFLEVSPGDARYLEQKTNDRIPGGTRLTIPDFGTSTMILCTTDLELCERIQRHVRSIQPVAAQMAIRQAEIQLSAVREVHERLKADGHIINNEKEIEKRRKRGIETKPPDAEGLVKAAEDYIKNARAAQETQDYGTSWGEARRALRPLRHLMFGYWAQGMAELKKVVEESFNGPKIEYKEGEIRPYPKPAVIVTAASCPPAISFYTLPQMHIWKDWAAELQGYRFGANLVPSGSFDDANAVLSAGWTDVSHQYDQIDKRIRVPRREPAPSYKSDKEQAKKIQAQAKKKVIQYEDEQVDPGDHVLMLSVKAKSAESLDKLMPSLDEPAAAIRSPSIRVGANNLIRISVLMRRPSNTIPGKGGVIIRDSIGGEQFEYRTTDPSPAYSRIVLYRKAPVDDSFHVTLGLAGFGDVYFDDFRVQVIEEATPHRRVEPDLAQRRRPAGGSPGLPDPRMPADTAVRSPDNRRPR